MKVLHQLRGRVRVREPRLMSDEYCRQLMETLSRDDRITDVSIKQACWSVAICYHPDRASAAEILDLFRPPKKTVEKIQIQSKNEAGLEQPVETKEESQAPPRKTKRKTASTAAAKPKTKTSVSKKATS